jgi:hypothetical protein
VDSLREKVFQHIINEAINRLRTKMCAKYKPKKQNRFLTGSITYELGPGNITQEGVTFEISSKIPTELFQKNTVSEKYFRDVKKIMNTKSKKPASIKMENIVRSTIVNELKERDYVKCAYVYSEKELFTDEEVEQALAKVSGGTIDLSGIRGANTLAGKAVLFVLGENIFKNAHENLTDLIKANEETLDKYR